MKNWHKLLAIFIFVIGFDSCSTSSAASEELHPDIVSDSYAYLSPQAIVYASSISNLISTFPKFGNDDMNKEVSNLKIALSDYLSGIRSFNQSKKQKSLDDFEKYYKKIQKMRKLLIKDDDEVLNRYLVKIKTNMNLLENSQAKEATTSMSSN